MSDEALPQPERDEKTGVPFCSESCRHYDGKRCKLLGFRPGHICEPAVALLTAENARLREELAHAQGRADELETRLTAADAELELYHPDRSG